MKAYSNSNEWALKNKETGQLYATKQGQAYTMSTRLDARAEKDYIIGGEYFKVIKVNTTVKEIAA